MKIILTLFFITVAFYSNAQTLHLSVTDDVGTIVDSRVFKNDSLIEMNESYYIIPINNGDKISIKHNWYQDTVFRIKETLTPSDTLFKIIQLRQKTKRIDEVVISAEKYQLLYEKSNEFVIDYYPLSTNNILLLTKIGKNRYLKILDEDNNPKKQIQLYINPTELLLDAMGNFHVLTTDSVYQLRLSDTNVFLMKGISLTVFQTNISNLIAISENNAFYKNYSDHNQLFTIETLSKQNGRKEIYRAFDKVGCHGALDSYNKIIRYYIDSIAENQNLILLGLWSGNLLELLDDAALVRMYGWYKGVMSLPLKVSVFGMLDNLVILDNVNNSILHMNYSTCEVIHTATPKFELSRNYYFDYFYDALYTFSIQKGITEVFHIDTDTGEAIPVTQLTDVLLPRNIKVSNKWVYFTVLDSDGYNKLLKVRH